MNVIANLQFRICAFDRCGTWLTTALAFAALFSGCASSPVNPHWMDSQSNALKCQLLQLGSLVDTNEATRVAEVAVEQSAVLAREYRAVRPAWLGNYLVNLGLRDRGHLQQSIPDRVADSIQHDFKA